MNDKHFFECHGIVNYAPKKVHNYESAYSRDMTEYNCNTNYYRRRDEYQPWSEELMVSKSQVWESTNNFLNCTVRK